MNAATPPALPQLARLDHLGWAGPVQTRSPGAPPATGAGVKQLDLSGTTQVRNVDSDGALVASSAGRLVALLGVPNLVVVDTPDALLVADPAHAQQVKAIVDGLKADGQEKLV